MHVKTQQFCQHTTPSTLSSHTLSVIFSFLPIRFVSIISKEIILIDLNASLIVHWMSYLCKSEALWPPFRSIFTLYSLTLNHKSNEREIWILIVFFHYKKFLSASKMQFCMLNQKVDGFRDDNPKAQLHYR